MGISLLAAPTKSLTCHSDEKPGIRHSMFEMDHVAIPCPDIARGVDFYVQNFGAQVLYQDATWAFLRMGQGKLALVTPIQPPPHVALRLDEASLEAAAARVGKTVDLHRDGICNQKTNWKKSCTTRELE